VRGRVRYMSLSTKGVFVEMSVVKESREANKGKAIGMPRDLAPGWTSAVGPSPPPDISPSRRPKADTTATERLP